MITEDIITEDYCSPEIVKLLKEKGFKCGATYSKGFVKDGDGFVGGLVRHEDNITHQRARKWSRKVYDIHISVDKTFLINDIDNKPYLVRVYTKKYHTSYNSWSEYHSTYEGAVEAALKHILESDYFPELKENDEEWEVNTGLYKCIKRMFDDTPESKLLFETGNLYKCISKHDIAEFESSYGHSVFLIDPDVRKHFVKIEDERIEFESKFKPGDWISNGRYLKKIIDINSDWPYYIFQDGSSYRIKEVDAKWYIMPNMDELEWIDMETNENHCYSCELFDRKNEMCKCSTLCKNYRNTYKGFYIR